jgi:hypothetical protein
MRFDLIKCIFGKHDFEPEEFSACDKTLHYVYIYFAGRSCSIKVMKCKRCGHYKVVTCER